MFTETAKFTFNIVKKVWLSFLENEVKQRTTYGLSSSIDLSFIYWMSSYHFNFQWLWFQSGKYFNVHIQIQKQFKIEKIFVFC